MTIVRMHLAILHLLADSGSVVVDTSILAFEECIVAAQGAVPDLVFHQSSCSAVVMRNSPAKYWCCNTMPTDDLVSLKASKKGESMAKQPSRTDLLVQKLIAAEDGRIEILRDERDSYEHLVRAAKRFKKVPEGQRIRIDWDYRQGKTWVILEDLPEWMTVTLPPIDVPVALRQVSEVVEQLRNRDDFSIRYKEKNRALRLMEALVREARRRGYKVEPTPEPRRDRWGYSYRDEDRGHISVSIGSQCYNLSVSQEIDKVPHVLSKAEEARAVHGGWAPKHDEVPSTRLRITIEGKDAPFWQSVWSDKSDRPLEDSLAQVLQEIELRHQREVEKRQREIKEYEERKVQWEAARRRASKQLIESHHASILIEQLENWELASRLREYLTAMEEHLGSDAGVDNAESAKQWVKWAQAFVEDINPLNADLSMPHNPSPTYEKLKPFMEGWSPYGPYRDGS